MERCRESSGFNKRVKKKIDNSIQKWRESREFQQESEEKVEVYLVS